MGKKRKPRKNSNYKNGKTDMQLPKLGVNELNFVLEQLKDIFAAITALNAKEDQAEFMDLPLSRSQANLLYSLVMEQIFQLAFAIDKKINATELEEDLKARSMVFASLGYSARLYQDAKNESGGSFDDICQNDPDI